MAVAEKVPVQDNGAMQFLSTLFTNSGSLFGSGETTSKETPGTTTTSSTSSTPSVSLDNSNQVLNSVLQGANPDAIDQMIQGIMDKAKDAFGPNISNSLAAGNRALTDTTLGTIQQKAMGTATAQAAQAKLQAIAQNNQIAATIVDNQLSNQTQLAAANKSTTSTTVGNTPTTKTTTTAASPTGKLLQAAGIAATGYSLYDKATKKKGTPPINGGAPPDLSEMTEGLFGTDVGTGGQNIGGTTSTLGNVESGFSPDAATSSAVSDVSGPVSEFSGNLFEGGFSSAFEAPAAELSTDALIDTTTAAATDALGATATDVAVDAGAAAGGDVLGGALGDIGGDIVGDSLVDFGVETAADWGLEELIPIAVAGWIICTQLKKEGEISSKDYFKAARHFVSRPEQMKEGYRLWARPYVKLMTNKRFGWLFVRFMRPIAQGRINYINGKWNFIGWLTFVIGEPVCMWLGKFVNKGYYGRTI